MGLSMEQKNQTKEIEWDWLEIHRIEPIQNSISRQIKSHLSLNNHKEDNRIKTYINCSIIWSRLLEYKKR